MTVGLLFGTFWYGLGVLMWWWPAAIFVAFSNEDVTPGARAFAIMFIFFGLVFFSFSIDGLGTDFVPAGTILTVGVLLLLNPVAIWGTDPEGPLTPKTVGVVGVLGGGVMAVSALL